MKGEAWVTATVRAVISRWLVSLLLVPGSGEIHLDRSTWELLDQASSPASDKISPAPRKVRFDGVQMPAYRFVFCVDHGVALPWHQVVRHRCHNRLCINPAHLQQGDRRDNKHDDWTRAAYGLDLLGLRRG